MNLRRIGLTQPPRPSPLRVDPRGLFSGLVTRINVHHPLMPSSLAFGIFPPQSSLQLARSPLRSTSPRPLPKEWPAWSTPSSGSPERLPRKRVVALVSVSSPGWLCFVRLRGTATSTSPVGPYDAYQSTFTRSNRATLQPHANRPGLPLLALLVSWISQPCFMPDRPWAPALQRFLPVRRRQILSDRAVLPAVSHHP